MQNDSLGPLVSICMPAYNAENFIAAAVGSILSQSYSNIELIAVNDGSTDRTLAILEAIQDPRLKIINSENKGQSAAANQAYHASSGQFIKFMDADDLLSDNFIKSQLSVIKDDNNAIALAVWGRFYNNDLTSFKLQKTAAQTPAKPIDWLTEAMFNKQVMLQSALWLIPRSIIERGGLWREELSLINDFEFFIRLLLHAEEIRYTPEAILYYRSGVTNSLSRLRSRAGAESAFKSINWGTEHLLAVEGSERTRKIAADCFQYFVYDFYPNYPDLLKMAESRINDLGGSDRPFIAGGYTKRLARFIGWRATKRIKQFITQLKGSE